MARGGLHEQESFKLSLKDEKIRQRMGKRKRFPGRGNNIYKGPVAEKSLAHLKN